MNSHLHVLLLSLASLSGVTIGHNEVAYTVSEGDPSVSVCIAAFSGALDRDFVVTVSTTDNTAIIGGKY